MQDPIDPVHNMADAQLILGEGGKCTVLPQLAYHLYYFYTNAQKIIWTVVHETPTRENGGRHTPSCPANEEKKQYFLDFDRNDSSA